jgi:hypothetical protein
MSVATRPGQAEFTLTPSPSSSVARMRVIAFRAAFDTRYPGDQPPISLIAPIPLDTFTMRGCSERRNSGSSAIERR